MKVRKSNFEFFRILSAFVIIMHHYVLHSDWNFGEKLGMKPIFLDIIESAGKFGVNCFLLISGYFLVNKVFKPKKLLHLWLQVFFYSISIFLIFAFFGKDHSILNVKNTILASFPIVFQQYWFISSYVLLYCLSPFLNILVENMNKKQHLSLLIVFFVFLSIKPVISLLVANYGAVESGMWFLFIYFIAAYIKIYPESFTKSAKSYFIKGAVVFLIIVFLIILLAVYNHQSENALSKGLIMDMQSPLYLLLAILLFCGVKNWDIGSIPVVNLLGSATLGVYLIHDNSYVRHFLWKELTVFKAPYYGVNLVWTSAVIIISVYVVCSVIDILRQKLFILLHIVE
ncbi:acyltransferase [Enterococcus rotai]|uniref:acyltransferase n=1 Tax=Enterococcus rotai TaxID=118060 RepID=UPI0032B4C36F